jgi:hypothetical protein
MLSEKQVLEIVPVGRTTVYRMEKGRLVSEIDLHLTEPQGLVRRRDRRVAERG